MTGTVGTETVGTVTELQATFSKSGLHCLDECGGGRTSTGEARILTNADGTAPTAIHILRSGHLACESHAIVPITPGMFVINASHHRGDFTITVGRIIDIDGDKAVIENFAEYSFGEWDVIPPEYLIPAIEAAKAKAMDYHCRRAYWVTIM